MLYYYYKGSRTGAQLILVKEDCCEDNRVIYSSVSGFIKTNTHLTPSKLDKGPYNSIDELMADNFTDFL